MNWLAHVLLSKNHIDHQLGNLLADPLKGRSWAGASRAFNEGMNLHRRIDAYTDASPIVAQSRYRLGKTGRLRGVVIDIAYDHLLVLHWDQYCRIDHALFLERFHRDALESIDDFPAEARDFILRLIHNGILSSYGSPAGLETALRRIDKRLSNRLLRKESASQYLPAIRRERSGIQEDFNLFFPALITHVKTEVSMSAKGHWLR